MNITSENYKIIHCLEEASFSLKELAEILGSDARRIKYNLAAIGKLIGKEKITLDEIHNMVKEKPEELKTLVKSVQSLTADERRFFLILSFMESDIINQNRIAEILGVSRKTIAEDMMKLKENIEIYRLGIVSINSMGVQLVGAEEDKREFFRWNFHKLWMEGDHLPAQLLKFLDYHEELIREYDIKKAVKKILREKIDDIGAIVFFDLELLLSISLIREKFRNSMKKDEEVPQVSLEIQKGFDQISTLTNYEKKQIIHFLTKLNMADYEKNYRSIIEETRKLLEFIKERSPYRYQISEEKIHLVSMRLEYMKFKQHLNVRQLYVFNKNFAKDYMELFNEHRKIFQEYFNGKIDSLDEIFIFQSIVKDIGEKKDEAREREGEIAVVYKYFPITFIKDICYKWERHLSKGRVKYISERNIEEYLLNNKVKTVVKFENIKIPEGKCDIKKYTFPMTELDLEVLKNL